MFSVRLSLFHETAFLFWTPNSTFAPKKPILQSENLTKVKATIVMLGQPKRTRHKHKAEQQPFAKLVLLSHVEHTARNNGVISSHNFCPCDKPAWRNSANFHRLCAWVTRCQKGALPSSSILSSR
jgi:hypothetical protein